MNKPDVVQIHALTSYPGVLLNRDDVGAAKSINFGNAVRTRVSSQCLKKHWREAEPFAELAEEIGLAVRSTYVYKQLVEQALVDKGFEADIANSVTTNLMNKTVSTKSAKDKSVTPEGEDRLAQTKTTQLLVLTRAEIEQLVTLAVQAANNLATEAADLPAKKRMAKLTAMAEKAVGQILAEQGTAGKDALKKMTSSLDTAMFGRMITSTTFANVAASVSVAHALTTHSEQSAVDYFTAVDTLVGDQGAGLLQDAELTSGVFYVYVSVDMNQLRENLGTYAHLADGVVRSLIRAIATVSPGAKRGSTAPYTYAEMVLLERGGEQPRTLANAFRKAVVAGNGDLLEKSADKMMEHYKNMAAMYGNAVGKSALASTFPIGSREVLSLEAATNNILGVV